MCLHGVLAILEPNGDIKLGRLAVHERLVLLDDLVRLFDGIGRHRHGAINKIGEQRQNLRPTDVAPLLGGGDRFALGGDQRVGQVVVRDPGLVVVDVIVELLEFPGGGTTTGQAKGGGENETIAKHTGPPMVWTAHLLAKRGMAESNGVMALEFPPHSGRFECFAAGECFPALAADGLHDGDLFFLR